MQVIDHNNIFRKYDFSSLITEADNQEACTTIKNIIENGGYFTNSPKFQTNENLFGRKESIWLKYRMSFLFSVFMYLGHEVKVTNMMSWSFMTNLAGSEDRETLWHNHWHPQHQNGRMMSGIFYLHIPDDVKDIDYAGTEMAPYGLDSEEKYFVTPTKYSWLIYPGDKWHRPGIVQSNQYRFILAADVEYFI